ncbi:hypothetical protein [Vibrio phage BONAISHI]|nr:hypothetical protein [Vibrio phage BONAISHI]
MSMNAIHKAKLNETMPGDYLLEQKARVLKHKDDTVYLRQGRNILEMNLVEDGEKEVTFLPGTYLADKVVVGCLYRYEYCRGISHEGIGLLRGMDDHEYWLKTIKGDNHFSDSRGGHYQNFVIFNNVTLSILAPAEDLALGNI